MPNNKPNTCILIYDESIVILNSNAMNYRGFQKIIFRSNLIFGMLNYELGMHFPTLKNEWHRGSE